MNYNKNYKLYEENGHLGIMVEDGTKMTPAVYDEIQMEPIHEEFYICRAFFNWDKFELKSGQVSIYDRYGMLPNGQFVSDKCTSTADREIYDSISEWEEERGIFTYKGGMFGYKSKEGTATLPEEYDDIDRWCCGDVIDARKGDHHFYFDLQGNEILTAYREEKGQRFWSGYDCDEKYHDSELIALRQLVDTPDDQTYPCEAGLVRFNRYSVEGFHGLLTARANVLPIKKETSDLFLDSYAYDFDAAEVKIAKPKCYADWEKGVQLFEKMHVYKDNFIMIDVLQMNENTTITQSDLCMLEQLSRKKYKSFRKFPHVQNELQRLSCIALGCDNSLADGEIRWTHCEFRYE